MPAPTSYAPLRRERRESMHSSEYNRVGNLGGIAAASREPTDEERKQYEAQHRLSERLEHGYHTVMRFGTIEDRLAVAEVLRAKSAEILGRPL